MMFPRWVHLKKLGRPLLYFKVHDFFRQCEFYCMPYEEAVKKYSGKSQDIIQMLEWCNPEGECVLLGEICKLPESKQHLGKRATFLDSREVTEMRWQIGSFYSSQTIME